jgi:hypothetical protein
MAKTKKTRSRKKPYLPGMAPPSLPNLNAAVEAYYETKCRRMELTQQEADQKAEVLRLMKEHDLEKYLDHDYSPELEVIHTKETEETVSVKAKKAVPVEVNGDSDDD